MKLHEVKQAINLQFTVDGNGPYNVMSSKGDIHDTYDSKKEASRVAAELNKKHKLDEDHPMTRMMMSAMSPPTQLNKENKKKKKKCRGCGDPKVVMKGLCKKCAEDTYADRD